MDQFENNTIRCRDAVYSVQGLIGAGRFSRVYQATVSGTGKRVAVKALNNDGSSRPTKEAEELAVLNALRGSPVRARYVRVVDAVRLSTGTVCFVMERLGTTLQAVLHNIGPLPMSMCRPVVRQIAQGLAGLRHLGIVHADLKPDNIMFCSGLGNNHLVKIIDFGWAFRAKDAPTMRKKKFQAVPYRAPEVCWRGTVGHGLDVWALGCIMPEIVTAVKLFEAADERQLAALIVRALGVHEAPPMERLARHPIACDGDRTAALTDGWIRFRNLYENATAADGGDRQKSEDVAWFADLTYKMLTVKPDRRISAADALAHPFLTMKHFVAYPSTKMTKTNADMMGKCKLHI